MQDNKIIGNFLLTKKFENFKFNNGIDLSLLNLKVNEQSTSYSLFLSIFNNYDLIIHTLENSKKLIKEPFWNVPDYIEENLISIDEIISKLISREIFNYIDSINSNLYSLEKSLKSTLKLIDDCKKNNDLDFVEELNEDVKRISEKLYKAQKRDELLKTYIDKLILYLSNYKFYFDLYFGIADNTALKKKDSSFFQSLLNVSFNIPKHQVHQAFIDDTQVVLANSLMLSCYKKLKESSNKEHISDIEIYESIYRETQELNNNDSFFTLCNYEISSIKDLLCIYFNFFIENKITINKCKNCGKYFIPLNRTDEKYCNNISPQKSDKTCKEYGVKKAYTNTVASNPIKNEHVRTTQFYRVKISRAKKKNDITTVNSLSKLLNKYFANYKKQLKKYESNKLSESEFIEWIIEQKQ